MENIAQKLRKAYDLITNANTNDIDAYMLAVEEANGYVAEALDMCDSPEMGRVFPDDGNTRFFIDEDEVSCEEFNDYFDRHDVGWQQVINEHGTLVLTIFTDDRS